MKTTSPASTAAPATSASCTNVAILGATGSIGTATVEVIRHLNRVDRDGSWRVWAASGHNNLDVLQEIVDQSPSEERPLHRLILSDPGVDPGDRFERCRRRGTELRFGPEALVEAAADPQVDVLVASIVGRAGLESTVAAVEAGKRVALANKETLVVAGNLVRSRLAESGATLLPVDSEHSAIWQCLCGSPCEVKKLILTASGGPFRGATAEQMHQARPEDALAHPTWQMGRKITIDSATMMNKALEIIEARWLFDVPAERIEVMVHPQSIIHSMVEFEDGSVLSQMSPPDMRLPIQYALTHPRRLPCPAEPLDRDRDWELTLQPADLERFPALELGFEVARVGGTAGAVINAANEVAVGLFLSGKIRFTDIVPVCRNVLQTHHFEPHPTLARLLELDRWARSEAESCADCLK